MQGKVNRADWGYVGIDPDPGFDAKHNQKVIDEVIRENDLLRKRKEREFKDKSQERTSAVASYIKSVTKDKSNMTPADYFGRKQLAYLRGKEILEKLKNAAAKA